MQYLFQYLYVFLQAPSQQFNYYYHSQVFTILSCCPFITLFACLALSQPLLMSAIFCMSDLSLLCLLSGWLYKYLIWKWKANTKSYWQNADFSSSCVCVSLIVIMILFSWFNFRWKHVSRILSANQKIKKKNTLFSWLFSKLFLVFNFKVCHLQEIIQYLCSGLDPLLSCLSKVVLQIYSMYK